MKNFYFIRHAETEANAAQIMCGGGVDTPLTQLGIEQANKAQEILLTYHQNQPISHIIHSDMKRTRKTAKILNHSLNLLTIGDTNLKEHIVGDWEGVSWAEISDAYIHNPNPPNGEPFEIFKKRIHDCMIYYLGNNDIMTPLFVAHGGVWRAFIHAYNIMPKSHPNNAELFYFEFLNNQDYFPWDVYFCQTNGNKIKIDL
jgi:probable phosphoglycerate mutase